MFEYENEKPPIKLQTENVAYYYRILASMAIPTFPLILIHAEVFYLYLKCKSSAWLEYFKKRFSK